VTGHRDAIVKIFYGALRAVDPYKATALHIDRILSVFTNGDYNRVYVVGFGKAVIPMLRAIIDEIGGIITSGIVITKYGHSMHAQKSDKIKIYEAGHPLPDESGLRATREVLELLRSVDDRTLVLSLISGGGSALLVSPYDGITLEEKQRTTDSLLKAGADIYELNTVRKHSSHVKGGRLAETAYPAEVVSLILSDVINDRLDVIASGPTSPDKTTYWDAIKIIEKYRLEKEVPETVMDLLNKGSQGLVPETPKENNPVFQRVKNMIIGSNKMAINAAKNEAEALGYKATILSAEIHGEARVAARYLAKKALELKKSKNSVRKMCLIAGGETTVSVRGLGSGGRNMETALTFALEIEGMSGITFLSAGTDGTDGPTDAAGAIVDGQTVMKARLMGINPERYLQDNDSYNFFKSIDELFITGPTGTNVMDIQITLLDL
jgi:glycerate 2-kinase